MSIVIIRPTRIKNRHSTASIYCTIRRPYKIPQISTVL